MSALDEIRKKKNHDLDAIERLIVEAWECLDGREWMSDDAAEELAALRRAFDAARKYIAIVNNFCEQPGDEEEWLAALAEYDKCRAA